MSEWQVLPDPEGEHTLQVSWRPDGDHAFMFRVSDLNIMNRDDDDYDIEGYVKWDGCMNWSTNPQCAYHFCTPESVRELTQAFHRVWLFTRDNLKTADDLCYGVITRQIGEFNDHP